MTVEPLGAITESVVTLAKMVASSQRFQERRGVTTQKQALAHVYYPWLDAADHKALRPYCLIEQGTELTWEFRGGGRSNYLVATGGLKLWFFDNSRYEDTRDNFIDFGNFIDAVVKELVEIAGSDDLLSIDGFKLSSPPMCSDPRIVFKPDEYWGACFDVAWAPSRG